MRQQIQIAPLFELQEEGRGVRIQALNVMLDGWKRWSKDGQRGIAKVPNVTAAVLKGWEFAEGREERIHQYL